MNREDTDRANRRTKAIDQINEFKQDLLHNGFQQWRVDELRHPEAELSLRFNYASDEWLIRWDGPDSIHIFRIDLRLNKSVADQMQALWSQWLMFQSSRWWHFEPAEA